ncbi:MAG: DUF4142 domain-containing protein [Brevundimonas sp.]|nr:MAG: DUF4142 domain-containing protein [Brevundimonas sp.]
MRTKTLAMAAAAVAALSLAACGQGESGGAPDQQNQAANTVQDTTAGAVGAVAAPVAAATNESFVTNAAIGGMYEVEAGKIAAMRSTNPAIKAFGSKMVADHTAAGEKLKPLATALNLTIPAMMDQRHQGLIDNLRGATDQDFDRVYLQQQEAAHNETKALLEAFGMTSNDATLKTWASETLPTVTAHQAMVDQMDEANADAAK